MNHFNTKKDFQERGYKTPDDYFIKFESEFPFPPKEEGSFYSQKHFYSIAAILIILIGVGFFIQNNNPTILETEATELAYEDILVYDSSFDFETNLISMIDNSEMESFLFEDTKMDILEYYLETSISYDEY
jgi:hypothetical protein